MKKTKVIIPALGILLLSTAASVTGTVAWFTASNDVSVSGMQFQAKSEEAIVVSNESKESWLNTGVKASHTGEGKTFLSTSTKDFSTWYHAYSKDANNGQKRTELISLNVTEPQAGATNSGLGTVTTQQGNADINFNGQNIYLLNRFYVQSATQIALADQDLYVKDLAVTGASTNVALDASLRVGFVFGTNKFIFAPIDGATLGYWVGQESPETQETLPAFDVNAIADTSEGVVISGVNGISIPKFIANGEGSLEIKVYVWFEGEDTAHKSANVLGTMDNLNVSFSLGNKAHETQQNP